jgi:hypothetical protein
VVKLDLSKALPPQAYLYFSAFMPGLFFEFSILLANPGLIHQLTLNAQEEFVFGRYLILLIGLFLAFVIGNGLMLFASLLQTLLGLVYKTYLFLWIQFQKHVLLPILTRLTHNRPGPPPSPPRPVRPPPRWVVNLYLWTSENVQPLPSQEEKDVYHWWVTIAKQLMLKRYDLTEDKLPAISFEQLQDVLTIPTPEELRGSVLVNASYATGWAGLFASRFAPALCNKWYMMFAYFLIGCGLLHDWNIARRFNDPSLGNMLRLRAVLREFPKIQPAGPNQLGSANHQSEEDDS